MSALRELGATHFVETGPGRVLTNLVRKSLDHVEAEAPLSIPIPAQPAEPAASGLETADA
jgi:malonyl CoA-acyl carrier protein transacylase